jgi:hypothetical protein
MSFLSKFEYQKNDDNEMIAAIYPLREVMNQDSLIREHLGGSNIDNDGSGSSRFDGLGVPVGLYLSRKHIDQIQHMKKNPDIQKDCNVIDEDKFNNLLDKIVKKAKKRTSAKKNNKVKNGKTAKKR